MEKKDRKYTLKVNGKKIEVSEEIYRAYEAYLFEVRGQLYG